MEWVGIELDRDPCTLCEYRGSGSRCTLGEPDLRVEGSRIVCLDRAELAPAVLQAMAIADAAWMRAERGEEVERSGACATWGDWLVVALLWLAGAAVFVGAGIVVAWRFE